MVKKKSKSSNEKEDSGVSLDDAFANDDNVEYAESKPSKINKKKNKKGLSDEELEEDLDVVEDALTHIEENSSHGPPEIKCSKPVSMLKKEDKISIDGKQMEVDAHYVLMDHGTTKEMAIEIFDSEADKDYQIRYFDDQIKTTIELYELQEIMYFKKPCKKISW